MSLRVRLPEVPEELGVRALRRLRATPAVPPPAPGPTRLVVRPPAVRPLALAPPVVRVEHAGGASVVVAPDGERLPLDPDDPAGLRAVAARLVERP